MWSIELKSCHYFKYYLTLRRLVVKSLNILWHHLLTHCQLITSYLVVGSFYYDADYVVLSIFWYIFIYDKNDFIRSDPFSSKITSRFQLKVTTNSKVLFKLVMINLVLVVSFFIRITPANLFHCKISNLRKQPQRR